MMPVPEFPGYTCDREGNVWSGGRKLKPFKTSRGHLRVRLYREGIHTDKYIHHIVLETFVGPRPLARMVACHRDDNKENNHLDNLRWGTSASNVRDAIRNGKQGGRPAHKGGSRPASSGIATSKGSLRPAAKLGEMDIPMVFILRSLGLTQKEIGKRFGVSQPVIHDILTGKSWSHAPRGQGCDPI